MSIAIDDLIPDGDAGQIGNRPENAKRPRQPPRASMQTIAHCAANGVLPAAHLLNHLH